jgi:signal transduction histidine kinase
LSRVFENLIANALQYNRPGTKIEIGLEEFPDVVEISFRDDGVGMPKDLAEGVFRPFVRGDLSRNSANGGTGLGLAIAQRIVHAHGGPIRLKTEEGQGAEFRIKVPKM